MALTSKEAVARFKESEERSHVLVNDPANVGFYTTDTTPGKRVETYPHFINRVTNTTNGIIAQANDAVEKVEKAVNDGLQKFEDGVEWIEEIVEASNKLVTEGYVKIDAMVTDGLVQLNTVVTDGVAQIDTMLTDGMVQIDESVTLAHKWATNAEDVPVKPGEFSAYHWAKKAQQTLSAAGYIDYTIGAVDPSGVVHIEYKAIGHPAMDRLINPIINILARTGYTHTIAARSLRGFDILVYRPDGTPGVEVGEYIDCGSFACGDGTQCGQTGQPVVFIAMSIPIPNAEPPAVDCGTFQCGDGTECGQPGSAFQ